MKLLKRIGCGVVVLLVVLIVAVLVGAQVILKNKLGEVLQKTVVPLAEEKMKVDVAIGGASVNLIGASVDISDVKIGNPEGFVEPSLFALDKLAVDIGFKALLDKVIEIANVELKGAKVTIVRNEAKLINVKVLADTLKGEEKPAAEEPEKKPRKPKAEKPVAEEPEVKEEAVAAEGPAELPKAILKNLGISTELGYVDHAVEAGPLDLRLKLAVDMKNISTYEAEPGMRGTISITGALASDANLCVTDIKGEVSPITDPMAPTFEISGDVASIDLTLVKPYLVAAGFSCDSMSLKLTIVCKDGVFDEKQSMISLIMENLMFSQARAKTMPGGIDNLPSLTLPIPISGSITAPETPSFDAILIATVKENAGSIIKGAATSAIKREIGKSLGVGGGGGGLGIALPGLGGSKKSEPEQKKAEVEPAPKPEPKKDPAEALKKKVTLPF